jgi:hypothetical protein
LDLYGIVISEADYELKMLWQMPRLSEGEYFEVISDSGLESIRTEMTYTGVADGYYSLIEAGADGIFTFYNDGYIKTAFAEEVAQRVLLTRNGYHDELSSLICEGTADGVHILQSVYGRSTVGVTTSGRLNIALSDGINNVYTGEIDLVAGYPTTISTSELNDIVIQSGNGNIIQMAAGSAGHAVSFYTGGELDVNPQTNILTNGKATEPDTGATNVLGWYTEPTHTNLWDFENDVVTENIVLYAKIDDSSVSGDVNGDAHVDSDDVLLIQQFLSWNFDRNPNNNIEINTIAADVDLSGSVDSDDVLRIQQYLSWNFDRNPNNDITLGERP